MHFKSKWLDKTYMKFDYWFSVNVYWSFSIENILIIIMEKIQEDT